jgi:hypothetical protein
MRERVLVGVWLVWCVATVVAWAYGAEHLAYAVGLTSGLTGGGAAAVGMLGIVCAIAGVVAIIMASARREG